MVASIPASDDAASEDHTVRFVGWRSVPERLKTIAQWKRQGRSVMAAARKTPAAVVDWDGIQAKVYSEDQTRPYTPRPSTVAFRDDCQAFTAFINPRRDRYAFKPRRDWENRDWPQTTQYFTDETLERAYSHREGMAILPASEGDARWFAIDLDLHEPASNPGRFLAQVATVHDTMVEEGDDFFMACREKDISGLHFWGFGPEGLSLADILRYANAIKASLIARHPNLFDDSLEIYPNPVRPFSLPIFPGRCPILDVPLEGVSPREQLSRLVQWIANPGKPMPKADLLTWLGARLPRRAAGCVGGMPTTIADTAAPLPAVVPVLPQPAGSPPATEGGMPTTIADTAASLPPISEEEFLAGLECGPPSPGYLPGEDFFAERARADLAGVLDQWERLRPSEGARAATSFLDGLGVPPAQMVRDEMGRSMVAGFRLRKQSKGKTQRDIVEEWQDASRREGWDAAARFLDGVKASLESREQADAGDDKPTQPAVVAVPSPVQAAAAEKADACQKPAPGKRTKVDYRGRFIEIQHSFWGLKERPPNGSLNAVLGPHLRLCLAFGHTPGEIDAFYRRELPDRPDLSFSKRLSENPEKVFRSEVATARKIEADNGYQPDPETSTAIFRRLAAAFRRRGLDPLDPTAFGRYRRAGQIDRTPREVELGEEAKEKVKEHAGWLHRDAAVVFRAARLVAGFVEANPGRQLAAVLVPDLCGGLPVKWLCDSDIKARRCKKAERFLAALVAAGVLEVARPAVFLGPRNPDNRATEYALGEAVRAPVREGGRQLLIADTAAACPAPWHDLLARELRRLRRRRAGRHGPSERRRVA